MLPFDVHSHTGADIDGSTRTAEEHMRDLEAVGGRSVVFPFCVESGYEAENRRVVEECGRTPAGWSPFARIDPRVSGVAATAAALAAGARGIKLHPRGEDFRLEHPNVDAIFAAAAETRAPVLIHAGAGVGSFGGDRHRARLPPSACPIVLAHAGISDLAWLWRVLPEHPNIYFDTAWWNPPDLLALFALVPPGRILFGSDAPYMGVELGMATTLRAARFAGLSDDAIELVMGAQLEASCWRGSDRCRPGARAHGRRRPRRPSAGSPRTSERWAARCWPAETRPTCSVWRSRPTDGRSHGRELDPRIAELIARWPAVGGGALGSRAGPQHRGHAGRRARRRGCLRSRSPA